MNIIFLGAPGVGKGTLSHKLSGSLHYPHIATGNMLRENVIQKTTLGLEAKKFMDEGHLVPDSVVIGMVDERLSRADAKNGIILDGFPRTIAQAEELKKKIKIDIIINLQASDEIIVNRISKRRTCESCHFVYHLDFIKPNREGYCDKCSGFLIQRDDDKPEAVKKRLEVYYAKTAPLVDYYKKEHLLVNVDGSGLPDEVFALVEEVLKKKR